MELQPILDTAINAARQAGELIREKCGKAANQAVKSNSFDLVTEVDKACEELIRRVVAESFPDHHILGEEGVAPGSAASVRALEELIDSPYLWIIDPIDGTTNFIHGFPASVVSIGVASRGQLIAGVIYDPFRDELFAAKQGQGAFLNGERIHVSKETTLQEAIIATGSPASTRMRSLNMTGLVHLTHLMRGFRCLGSAAIHLAYTAAGRISGFWEMDLNAWDLSAGCLLVQEAGGTVTDTLGQPYNLGVRHIAATNGRIHQELITALQAANATGYEQL